MWWQARLVSPRTECTDGDPFIRGVQAAAAGMLVAMSDVRSDAAVAAGRSSPHHQVCQQDWELALRDVYVDGMHSLTRQSL